MSLQQVRILEEFSSCVPLLTAEFHHRKEDVGGVFLAVVDSLGSLDKLGFLLVVASCIQVAREHREKGRGNLNTNPVLFLEGDSGLPHVEVLTIDLVFPEEFRLLHGIPEPCPDGSPDEMEDLAVLVYIHQDDEPVGVPSRGEYFS